MVDLTTRVLAQKQTFQANLHTVRVLGVLHIFSTVELKSVHSLKNNVSFLLQTHVGKICQIYEVSLRNSIS